MSENSIRVMQNRDMGKVTSKQRFAKVFALGGT